ncbi:hypothetical protein BS47DRAFT_1326783 [Hydnum rufescens UP504]|uniref:Uncharacterized protein n=1 Tax=Hydnum rufescens UP504 TaxID=1448309 RepID=A0A9P6B3M6_9AGAM|nr:hypothetical protein BS47DRAFT_1326783 [Hydnum rufescens UP504]
MDVQLSAPLRIQPTSSTPLSVEEAHEHLAAFLHRYQNRTSQYGGETTLASAQLEKLAAALNKERVSTLSASTKHE